MHISNRFVIVCNIQIVIRKSPFSFYFIEIFTHPPPSPAYFDPPPTYLVLPNAPTPHLLGPPPSASVYPGPKSSTVKEFLLCCL